MAQPCQPALRLLMTGGDLQFIGGHPGLLTRQFEGPAFLLHRCPVRIDVAKLLPGLLLSAGDVAECGDGVLATLGGTFEDRPDPGMPGPGSEPLHHLHCSHGTVQVSTDLIQLVPAIGELVDLGAVQLGESIVQAVTDEPHLQLLPQLRSPRDPQQLPDCLQLLGRTAQEPGGHFGAVGGRAGMPDKTLRGHFLRGHHAARGQQVAATPHPVPAGKGAPAQPHVGSRAASLREQERGEELVSGLGTAPILDPQPPLVSGRGRLPPVGIAPRGLDVVAERLPGTPQGVDVVRGDVSEPRDQRGQRHQGRLPGLIAARELHPAVGIPVLGDLKFPQVHHTGPQHLPAVGPGGAGKLTRNQGITPGLQSRIVEH